MATTVTPTTLVSGTASTTLPVTGGTAFTDAADLEIAYPDEGKLLLVINSTYAGANSVVVKAGDFHAAGKGDLTVVTAENDVLFLEVDSDRHKDTDGNITLDIGASNTGFVLAFYTP